MSHFRRAYVPGGSFFFTVVTEQRAPILCTDTSRVFLRTAIRECRQQWSFRIDALVLLDNHLHAILTLPEGDTRYSARWAENLRTGLQNLSGSGLQPSVFYYLLELTYYFDNSFKLACASESPCSAALRNHATA